MINRENLDVETIEQVEAFIEHIPYDKDRVEKLFSHYYFTIKKVGQNIIAHKNTVWSSNSPDMQEFLDFIDGNGFIIDRYADPEDTYPVQIDIIYDKEC